MTDVAFGGALLAARSLFARGPTRRMIRVITSGYVNNDAFGQVFVLTAARP
jgi:hypothetical protein